MNSGDFDWIKTMKCSCGKGYFEFINVKDGGILVNCESKGRTLINNFWMPSRVCNNPLCEWSKIKFEVNAHNMCSTQEAWEYYDNETNK